MTPRVHGRRWQIHHEDREGLYGECDWSARTITIHTSLKNCRRQFRLEILLHEVLHASSMLNAIPVFREPLTRNDS